MRDYRRRGTYWLVSLFCIIIIGVILCLFPHTRYVGIALIILSPLGNLPAFITFRKMTSEEFEKQQKQEKMANDERNQQIGSRTTQIVVLIMMCSLSIGMIAAMIFNSIPAILANLGQFVVLLVSILIVRSALNKKM